MACCKPLKLSSFVFHCVITDCTASVLLVGDAMHGNRKWMSDDTSGDEVMACVAPGKGGAEGTRGGREDGDISGSRWLLNFGRGRYEGESQLVSSGRRAKVRLRVRVYE